MAIINGTAGDNFLSGGAGDDTIFGGPVDDPSTPEDESLVGTGDDFLFGGDGNDTLYGGDGSDFLFGGDGNDALNGGGGGDFLFGEASDDTLYGGASDDLLDGGDGHDTLFGDAGDDSLIGDSGDDTLTGGDGKDTLTGGDGSDVFKFTFDLEPGSGGGDTPLSFGAWLTKEHALDIGNLQQNEFVQNYKGWLDYLAGELRDNHGFDTIPQNAEVSFKQNDAGGTFHIEGLTSAQLDQIFGDATAISVKTGKTSQDRYYSDIDANSSIWGGSSEDILTSGDGFDTILDFTFGEDGDTLEFNGLLDAGFTLADFTSLFNVSNVDPDGNTLIDSTMLVLADSTPADTSDNDWGVAVQGAGHTIDDFLASSIFS